MNDPTIYQEQIDEDEEQDSFARDEAKQWFN
jgi:hypothetical protein